jgi:hypothetical protein
MIGLSAPAAAADEPPAANAQVANAKARAEAAGKAFEAVRKRSTVDPVAFDPEKLYRWSRRWMEAEQESSGTKEARVAAAEAHLERMKKLEGVVKQLAEKGGFAGAADVAAQTYFRLDAERDLARVKDK